MADRGTFPFEQVARLGTDRRTGVRFGLGGIAVACCMLTIFALALKPVNDPDFWWHLATGRFMATADVIPHHDLFSLTVRDHVWITHEWVTELLFYGGWSLGGYRLLMLATASIITLDVRHRLYHRA